ncbi:MAG TPA: hypothetical protein VGO45_02920 [Bacteroidia bacterium]|jgi:hypothetical protein|nr:hypothetical protein [Bacteroidia bacterium]
MTATLLSVATHEILHLTGVIPGMGSPQFDTNILLISLLYHSVYAIIGAYVTAKIAEERARKAVFILGSKEAIMWLLGILLLWKHNPAWFNITKAVLGIPLALLGGRIYAATHPASPDMKP